MNIEGKTDKQLQRMCVNKWKRKLKLSIYDIMEKKGYPSGGDCAFCVKYNVNGGACRCCPVKLKSGIPRCEGTPYRAALTLYEGIEYREHRKTKIFYKAVQKEIDFLESLEC